MQLNWKGKPYRPIFNPVIKVINPDVSELMRPLGKKKLGQAILTGSFISGKRETGPPPTPSPTPSFTPTPSATPAAPLSPMDLNALWWVDFTDTNNFISTGITINQAKNLITGNFDFEEGLQDQGPIYIPDGWLGFSGTASSNVYPLSSFTNTFSAVTGVTEFTIGWKGYWDDVQTGVNLMFAFTDTGGTAQLQSLLAMDNDPFPFTYNLVVWDSDLTPYTTGNGTMPADVWADHVINFYFSNIPGQMVTDYWINGSKVLTMLLYPGNGVYPLINPLFYLLWNGGATKITEMFYFDYPLTDSNIQGLFSYFNNKYVIPPTPTPTETPTNTPTIPVTPTPSPTTPGYVYILDSYTGATTGVSLRKLSSSYAGNAIRVRRDSDDAEQDIGFSGNDLDIGALTAFVGSDSAFIVGMYDQSGNGTDWSQITTAEQPMIVSGGTVLVDAYGKPYMQFDGSDDNIYSDDINGYFFTGSGAFYASTVGQHDNDSGYKTYFAQIDGTVNRGIGFLGGNSNNLQVWWGNDLGVPGNLSGMKLIVQCSFDGTTRITDINNYTQATDTPLGKDTLPLYTYMGRTNWIGDNFWMLGYIQELIIWNSDQSANLSGIKSAQNSYYQAY